MTDLESVVPDRSEHLRKMGQLADVGLAVEAIEDAGRGDAKAV